MKKRSAPVFIFTALLILVTAAGCSNDPEKSINPKKQVLPEICWSIEYRRN